MELDDTLCVGGSAAAPAAPLHAASAPDPDATMVVMEATHPGGAGFVTQGPAASLGPLTGAADDAGASAVGGTAALAAARKRALERMAAKQQALRDARAGRMSSTVLPAADDTLVVIAPPLRAQAPAPPAPPPPAPVDVINITGDLTKAAPCVVSRPARSSSSGEGDDVSPSRLRSRRSLAALVEEDEAVELAAPSHRSRAGSLDAELAVSPSSNGQATARAPSAAPTTPYSHLLSEERPITGTGAKLGRGLRPRTGPEAEGGGAGVAPIVAPLASAFGAVASAAGTPAAPRPLVFSQGAAAAHSSVEGLTAPPPPPAMALQHFEPLALAGPDSDPTGGEAQASAEDRFRDLPLSSKLAHKAGPARRLGYMEVTRALAPGGRPAGVGAFGALPLEVHEALFGPGTEAAPAPERVQELITAALSEPSGNVLDAGVQAVAAIVGEAARGGAAALSLVSVHDTLAPLLGKAMPLLSRPPLLEAAVGLALSLAALPGAWPAHILNKSVADMLTSGVKDVKRAKKAMPYYARLVARLLTTLPLATREAADAARVLLAEPLVSHLPSLILTADKAVQSAGLELAVALKTVAQEAVLAHVVELSSRKGGYPPPIAKHIIGDATPPPPPPPKAASAFAAAAAAAAGGAGAGGGSSSGSSAPPGSSGEDAGGRHAPARAPPGSAQRVAEEAAEDAAYAAARTEDLTHTLSRRVRVLLSTGKEESVTLVHRCEDALGGGEKKWDVRRDTITRVTGEVAHHTRVDGPVSDFVHVLRTKAFKDANQAVQVAAMEACGALAQRMREGFGSHARHTLGFLIEKLKDKARPVVAAATDVVYGYARYGCVSVEEVWEAARGSVSDPKASPEARRNGLAVLADIVACPAAVPPPTLLVAQAGAAYLSTRASTLLGAFGGACGDTKAEVRKEAERGCGTVLFRIAQVQQGLVAQANGLVPDAVPLPNALERRDVAEALARANTPKASLPRIQKAMEWAAGGFAAPAAPAPPASAASATVPPPPVPAAKAGALPSRLGMGSAAATGKASASSSGSAGNAAGGNNPTSALEAAFQASIALDTGHGGGASVPSFDTAAILIAEQGSAAQVHPALAVITPEVLAGWDAPDWKARKAVVDAWASAAEAAGAAAAATTTELLVSFLFDRTKKFTQGTANTMLLHGIVEGLTRCVAAATAPPSPPSFPRRVAAALVDALTPLLKERKAGIETLFHGLCVAVGANLVLHRAVEVAKSVKSAPAATHAAVADFLASALQRYGVARIYCPAFLPFLVSSQTGCLQAAASVSKGAALGALAAMYRQAGPPLLAALARPPFALDDAAVKVIKAGVEGKLGGAYDPQDARAVMQAAAPYAFETAPPAIYVHGEAAAGGGAGGSSAAQPAPGAGAVAALGFGPTGPVDLFTLPGITRSLLEEMDTPNEAKGGVGVAEPGEGGGTGGGALPTGTRTKPGPSSDDGSAAQQPWARRMAAVERVREALDKALALSDGQPSLALNESAVALLKALVRRLKDTQTNVKPRAAAALATLFRLAGPAFVTDARAKDVVPPLVDLLADKRPAVAAAGLEALTAAVVVPSSMSAGGAEATAAVPFCAVMKGVAFNATGTCLLSSAPSAREELLRWLVAHCRSVPKCSASMEGARGLLKPLVEDCLADRSPGVRALATELLPQALRLAGAGAKELDAIVRGLRPAAAKALEPAVNAAKAALQALASAGASAPASSTTSSTAAAASAHETMSDDSPTGMPAPHAPHRPTSQQLAAAASPGGGAAASAWGGHHRPPPGSRAAKVADAVINNWGIERETLRDDLYAYELAVAQAGTKAGRLLEPAKHRKAGGGADASAAVAAASGGSSSGAGAGGGGIGKSATQAQASEALQAVRGEWAYAGIASPRLLAHLFDSPNVTHTEGALRWLATTVWLDDDGEAAIGTNTDLLFKLACAFLSHPSHAKTVVGTASLSLLDRLFSWYWGTRPGPPDAALATEDGQLRNRDVYPPLEQEWDLVFTTLYNNLPVKEDTRAKAVAVLVDALELLPHSSHVAVHTAAATKPANETYATKPANETYAGERYIVSLGIKGGTATARLRFICQVLAGFVARRGNHRVMRSYALVMLMIEWKGIGDAVREVATEVFRCFLRTTASNVVQATHLTVSALLSASGGPALGIDAVQQAKMKEALEKHLASNWERVLEEVTAAAAGGRAHAARRGSRSSSVGRGFTPTGSRRGSLMASGSPALGAAAQAQPGAPVPPLQLAQLPPHAAGVPSPIVGLPPRVPRLPAALAAAAAAAGGGGAGDAAAAGLSMDDLSTGGVTSSSQSSSARSAPPAWGGASFTNGSASRGPGAALPPVPGALAPPAPTAFAGLVGALATTTGEASADSLLGTLLQCVHAIQRVARELHGGATVRGVQVDRSHPDYRRGLRALSEAAAALRILYEPGTAAIRRGDSPAALVSRRVLALLAPHFPVLLHLLAFSVHAAFGGPVVASLRDRDPSTIPASYDSEWLFPVLNLIRKTLSLSFLMYEGLLAPDHLRPLFTELVLRRGDRRLTLAVTGVEQDLVDAGLNPTLVRLADQAPRHLVAAVALDLLGEVARYEASPAAPSATTQLYVPPVSLDCLDGILELLHANEVREAKRRAQAGYLCWGQVGPCLLGATPAAAAAPRAAVLGALAAFFTGHPSVATRAEKLFFAPHPREHATAALQAWATRKAETNDPAAAEPTRGAYVAALLGASVPAATASAHAIFSAASFMDRLILICGGSIVEDLNGLLAGRPESDVFARLAGAQVTTLMASHRVDRPEHILPVHGTTSDYNSFFGATPRHLRTITLTTASRRPAGTPMAGGAGGDLETTLAVDGGGTQGGLDALPRRNLVSVFDSPAPQRSASRLDAGGDGDGGGSSGEAGALLRAMQWKAGAETPALARHRGAIGGASIGLGGSRLPLAEVGGQATAASAATTAAAACASPAALGDAVLRALAPLKTTGPADNPSNETVKAVVEALVPLLLHGEPKKGLDDAAAAALLQGLDGLGVTRHMRPTLLGTFWLRLRRLLAAAGPAGAAHPLAAYAAQAHTAAMAASGGGGAGLGASTLGASGVLARSALVRP